MKTAFENKQAKIKRLESIMFISIIMFFTFAILTMLGAGIEIRFNVPYYSIRIALFFIGIMAYNFIKAMVIQITYEKMN